MLDHRITQLADVLINYSCALKAGERILIEAIDVPPEFTCECIRMARQAGGIPHVKLDLYRGETHDDIRLVFRDGRIVEATSTNTTRLNEVLDSEEGARYVGEFAVGVNPYCTRAMKDTLFDEKIAGSIHLTPGGSYDECDNGNHSDVHWDMVMRQTPEAGGGEMYFDGELVRKDGLFVLPELQALNPENLIP